jgi:Tfp pilus assembly protein PilN
MRAVNLIPADAKRASRGSSGKKALPTYLLLGALAIAVGLVTMYVLASNDVSQRQAKATTLQAEVAQVQAQSNGLSHYAQFSQMTQGRISSVRQLATTRFDWHATLAQISQVVPKNTSLATLNGAAVTANPTTGTAAPTSTGAPAGTTIELTGCTKSQPDVAKLMSRLRLIDGVAGVALNSSTKQESGGTSPASGSASGGSAQGCGNGTPSFDLKLAFATQPATPAAGGAATSTSTSTSSSTSTSTSSSTATSAAPSASGGTS